MCVKCNAGMWRTDAYTEGVRTNRFTGNAAGDGEVQLFKGKM